MDPTPDPTFFGLPERTQRRAVLGVLALYVVTMLATWPDALLVSDEAHYVGQAALFAEGKAAREFRDVLEGTSAVRPLSTYPVGTSALQAPFVKLAGWRGAFVVSLLSLVGTVLVLLRWLSELRRPPLFALVSLLFLGTSVQGRLAMSDSVTALVASGAFFLFWRGTAGHGTAWLGAGFLAGLSAAFRDPTPVLFAPLFGATLLRREWKAWQLVVGGFAGLAVRFAASKAIFGTFLFVRQVGDTGRTPLTLDAVPPNLLLYGAILVLALPLGLPSLFAFKDPRKPEYLVSALGMLVIYLMFPLPHGANGVVRNVVVHARYCNAYVPLVVYALSEWIPRLLAARPKTSRILAFGSIGAAAVLTLGVHVGLHLWGRTLSGIRDEIYAQTPEGAVVLTSNSGTGKFFGDAFGIRHTIERQVATPERVAAVVAKGEPVYAVFVDRSEADWRRQDAADNQAFVEALRARCTVETLVDRQASQIERLTIRKVNGCTAAAQ